MMNISWLSVRSGKLALCTLVCWISLNSFAHAAEVKWLNAAEEPGEAFNKAKYIVAYFQADWCSYCKKLETEVFQTEGFQALGDKAAFVKFDDKNDEKSKREVVEKNLIIESYPTLVVIKHEGDKLTEVNRIVGSHPAEEYLGLLRPLFGVENPAEQKLPDAIAGLGLTPDSNICQPGDLQCIIGKLNPALNKPLGGFEDLLNPPAANPTPPAAGQTLTND